MSTPKYAYHMLVANQLVNRAPKHEIFSFMNGFLGYDYIFIVGEDTVKTTFWCPEGSGTFEWAIMSLGWRMLELFTRELQTLFSMI